MTDNQAPVKEQAWGQVQRKLAVIHSGGCVVKVVVGGSAYKLQAGAQGCGDAKSLMRHVKTRFSTDWRWPLLPRLPERTT